MLQIVKRQEEEKAPQQEGQLTLTEFGNDLLWVALDNNHSIMTGKKQWAGNKSGKSGSVYTTTLQFHRKQIMFGLRLEKPIELKSFRIGLVVSKLENYMVVGEPYFAQIYAIKKHPGGGKREVFLGELEPVKDNSYLNHQVMVYEVSPNKFRGENYEQSLNDLKYLDNVTEFHLSIGHPQLTLVDKVSPMVSKSFQALNFAINFISVNGYSMEGVNFETQFKQMVRVRFFEFIDKIFNSERVVDILEQYFDLLNNKGDSCLYDLIKLQLDDLRDLFNIKMSRFLLLVSEKNEQMSKIVFEFLINNLENQEIFYNLLECILKQTLNIQFFNKFLENGKSQFKVSKGFGTRFCGVLCNFLTYAQDTRGDRFKFLLNIDLSFFKLLLQKYQEHRFDYSFERLIVLILYFLENGTMFVANDKVEQAETLQEFEDKNQGKSSEFTDQFYEALTDLVFINKDYKYLHFISYLSLKVERAKKLLLKEEIYDTCCQVLQGQDLKKMFDFFVFLHFACNFDEVHELMIKKGIHELLFQCIDKVLEYP